MKLADNGSNNAHVVTDGKGNEYLFSYATCVAYLSKKGRLYVTNKHWSTTTSKHINEFCNDLKRIEKSQEYFDNL